uniref:Metalloendopeptidase n=1 Tax=Oreochromis niloticus TaxID=8128 RepID=A0A669ERR8_ORENI
MNRFIFVCLRWEKTGCFQGNFLLISNQSNVNVFFFGGGGCFFSHKSANILEGINRSCSRIQVLTLCNMAFMKCTLSLLILLGASVLCWADEKDLSVAELLWRANKDVVHTAEEPFIIDDIAYENENQRNADPCTSSGCMWGKSSDGNVYVPYIIASHYSSRERSIIERGLLSFQDVSCIRFVPRTNQRDYLNIQSINGCYSYIGRRYYAQELSLQQSGCVYHDTVQHEVLHALGFNHEQTRSDRDQYIRVLWENITPGMEHNFDKINTLNQGTPYDYGSVMHYHKYAFSKNNQPTLVAIPDSNVEFGYATEISQTDILRLNRLYGC